MTTRVFTLEEPLVEAPAAVWVLALLCTSPFIVASALFCYGPAKLASGALSVLFAYSTIMLGYLGGLRAGIEIESGRPRWMHLAVSIVAPLVGFGLLLAQNLLPAYVRLGGFILIIVAQWLWDVTHAEGPAWRPRMRTFLTVGAGIPLAFALEQALHM
jgi:hypothetical protein